jgi:hypothetical protein
MWQFAMARNPLKGHSDILINAEHLWNASDSIRANTESFVNAIDSIEWHPGKHDLHNISTDERIFMDVKLFVKNADFLMRRGWESKSNLIDENDLHSTKHDLHTIWTDDVTLIDVKSFAENTYFSMHWRWESYPNAIDENDLHTEKHDLHQNCPGFWNSDRCQATRWKYLFFNALKMRIKLKCDWWKWFAYGKTWFA